MGNYIFAHVPLEPVFKSPYITMRTTKKLILELNGNKQAVLDVKLFDYNSKGLHSVQSLIDTGSYYNICKESIFKDANIVNTGHRAKYQPVGGNERESDIYKCLIMIPGISETITFEFFFVKEELVFSNHDIILGVEFLKSFEFHYNNPKDIFTLQLIAK